MVSNKEKKEYLNTKELKEFESVLLLIAEREKEIACIHPEAVLLRAALGTQASPYQERVASLLPHGIFWKMFGTASAALVVVLVVLGTSESFWGGLMKSGARETSTRFNTTPLELFSLDAPDEDFADYLAEEMRLLEEISAEEDVLVRDAAEAEATELEEIYDGSEELEAAEVVEV